MTKIPSTPIANHRVEQCVDDCIRPTVYRAQSAERAVHHHGIAISQAESLQVFDEFVACDHEVRNGSFLDLPLTV